MRIRMLSTQRGAEDGVTVRTYEKGKEYQLAETPRGRELGQVFLRERWAEDASTPAPKPLSAPPVQSAEVAEEIEASSKEAPEAHVQPKKGPNTKRR